MAYASKAGRARTSSTSPQAHAICDRCGFRYNRVSLNWQYDWRGNVLMNTNSLVCNQCTDEPQQQLRAIVLPPDPTPIDQPRIQDFVAASASTRGTSGQNSVDPITGIPIINSNTRTTQNNDTRSLQQTGEAPGGVNQTPGTDPNAPGNSDPGLPYNNTTVPNTGPLK